MTTDKALIDIEALADRLITGVRGQRAATTDSETVSAAHGGICDAPWLTSKQEAMALAHYPDLDALCDAADRITKACSSYGRIDSCSIVNARSGLCGEDCKWCAQATRHHTGCATYNAIDAEEVMQAAAMNEQAGIKRLSLVTSGRSVTDKDLQHFLDIYRRLSKETGLYLCASMGLLGRSQMKALREAGVKRYHCNMETSERFFPTLCTSHTPQDKRDTIQAARAEGLEVCSGGIIGMGESIEDRIEFAIELRSLGVDSVPINILNPIKGTPLEDTPLIGESEVIRTAAIFRFILPTQVLRFAGGRARLGTEAMKRMLHGGINGVLMGDMLTSIGNKVEEDRVMFKEAGMHL